MILIDTSAWIEFLRDTASPTCERVEEVLATDIAVADPIRMKVLAGARSEQVSGKRREGQKVRGAIYIFVIFMDGFNF